MTFAWESENWDRDREERLEGQRRYTEQVKVFTGPAEVSLGEWLDSRALYVNSHPQVLTRNQQERVIWKSAKEEQAGNETPESKGLREWLHSRERNAAVARKAAINLTAAFSRSTFVPDPSTPPFLSRTSLFSGTVCQQSPSGPNTKPAGESDLEVSKRRTGWKRNAGVKGLEGMAALSGAECCSSTQSRHKSDSGIFSIDFRS